MSTPRGADAGRAEAASTVVAARGLRAELGGRRILSDLDLEVRRGEILGIVGGSGSGKSVLLRHLIGLMTPARGSVRLLGQELPALGPAARHALRRRLGVLFQEDALFSSLTVGENLARVMEEHVRVPAGLARHLIELKLALVGLDLEVCDRYPAALSGGMRKKAGLARALALDPEIVFLDEPTAGLDPVAATNFEQVIRELHEVLGFTVVLVTHDLVALFETCTRIGVLHDGGLLVTGPPEEVRAFDHPVTRAFFGGPRGRAAARA